MVMVDEERLTVQQAAAALDVHPQTVRNWLRQGKLRGRRQSDRYGWRIPRSEVDRFIRDELLPEGDGEREG